MKKLMPALLALSAVALTAATIDLDNLFPYATQTKPGYIVDDNLPAANPQTDPGATLGRVLFYDKNLSLNGNVSCGSCHKQEFAFGDTVAQSKGSGGDVTVRHSMRLVNPRFASPNGFFWDERAATLESQVTQPIKDHIEMGFSGQNGQPDFDSLIARMNTLPYYPRLFTFVYGNPYITEDRVQKALAQFVRSLQSFDSKFDAGMALTGNFNAPFPNYTAEENAGKVLFLNPPGNGGAGCQGCHSAPEFDMTPVSLNNGIVGVAGSPGGLDLTVTRAPSLRDVANPSGGFNGPFMHTGQFTDLLQVINHYNSVPNNPLNTNLDQRLRRPNNQTQQLNLTAAQKNSLVAFLRTLTGQQLYTSDQWSNPFDQNGNLELLPLLSTPAPVAKTSLGIYPNPATEQVTLQLEAGTYQVSIFDLGGRLVLSRTLPGSLVLPVGQLASGAYQVVAVNTKTNLVLRGKLVKQ